MSMGLQEVVNIVNNTNKALEEKGWYVYSYQYFNMREEARMEFNIMLRPPYGSEYSTKWQTDDNITITEQCKGVADLRACADRFILRVNEQASLVDHMRGRFRQKLVDMAEEGERLGFAMEYVEVLRATSLKLATNALGAPRYAVTADDGYGTRVVDTDVETLPEPPFYHQR